MSPKFYITNRAAALELTRNMREDGWAMDEVIDYWINLDYDIFWAAAVVADSDKQNDTKQYA
jgi:hypothetical protein